MKRIHATSSIIVCTDAIVDVTNVMMRICLISSVIVHVDVISIIAITTHSKYDKYQNNRNSSTTLAQMKANVNYKHSHNNPTNIHNPCMKNVLVMKAYVIK